MRTIIAGNSRRSTCLFEKFCSELASKKRKIGPIHGSVNTLRKGPRHQKLSVKRTLATLLLGSICSDKLQRETCTPDHHTP